MCALKLHTKARTQVYPLSNNQVERLVVPDEKVDWTEKWEEYKPPNYTSDSILSKPGVDPEIGDPRFKPKWNHVDGTINRVSHTGLYEVVDVYPRNPIGRTGLTGRGVFGRWGPNHIADPIITRWKRDISNTLVTDHSTNLPILQFVAILRSDTEEWAIPGDKAELGEKLTPELQREFGQEALYALRIGVKEKFETEEVIKKFFKGGIEIYKGYVDDPRNTDNAWMETIATNFHDGTRDTVAKFPLHDGHDGTVGVCWVDLNSSLKLYAGHVDFLEAVAQYRKGHW